METPAKRKFFLFRWIDYSSQVGGILASICLLGVTAIIVYEVIARYLFNAPTTWVGEMSIYLCMAIGFLGLAFGLKSDSHFSISIVTNRLVPKKRILLKIFTDFVGFLYSATFVYKGIEMAKFAYDIEDVSSGMMQVPLWMPWSLVPIGGFLLSLQFINKLAEDIKSLKQN
ncbi:MAG: TRAP transporter small permease [Proteobacteria bacterium]|nr:TRAP transporter small permease [Pseudomonadota bacterium]